VIGALNFEFAIVQFLSSRARPEPFPKRERIVVYSYGQALLGRFDMFFNVFSVFFIQKRDFLGYCVYVFSNTAAVTTVRPCDAISPLHNVIPQIHSRVK